MAKKKNTNIDPVETADSIPAEKAAEIVEAPVKKTTRRTNKKAEADTDVDAAVKAAETPAENTVPTETPVKKPRSKKAKAAAEETAADIKAANDSAPAAASDTTVTSAVAKEPKKASKKNEPTLTIKTILQVGDKEFDITNIAEAALKAYKSVHKRKNVTDFVIYIKPEDNAAYYTVNGEGAEDYKVEL